MKTRRDINTCHQTDNLRARRVNCTLWFSISKIMQFIIKMFYELSLIRSKTICIKFKNRKVKRQTMWQSREQWPGTTRSRCLPRLPWPWTDCCSCGREGMSTMLQQKKKSSNVVHVLASYLNKELALQEQKGVGGSWQRATGQEGFAFPTITGHIHHCGEVTLKVKSKEKQPHTRSASCLCSA